MQMIRTLTDLAQLSLPMAVKDELRAHFLLPWDGDFDEAANFWDETATLLILIEQHDTEEAILLCDAQLNGLISDAVKHLEYVVEIGLEGHLLGLNIYQSDGAGCFILTVNSRRDWIVDALTEQLNLEE
ncbi:hypothetical protein [Ferrimonas senticii]|uniref:hypothetical protein n=1 Tax=Ferrimonas senticii TaxID=394566 RepID=UPI00040B50E8|nr:hypothetical protein [Ferrimonas senticii]